jgi:hypothetical protein
LEPFGNERLQRDHDAGLRIGFVVNGFTVVGVGRGILM